MIHETLEKLQAPIEGLRPYHRNPRQGDVGTKTRMPATKPIGNANSSPASHRPVI